MFRFDRNDFEDIRFLVTLLVDLEAGPKTQAIACHDIGEFVRFHPKGRRVIGRLEVGGISVKGVIMNLMTTGRYCLGLSLSLSIYLSIYLCVCPQLTVS